MRSTELFALGGDCGYGDYHHHEGCHHGGYDKHYSDYKSMATTATTTATTDS